MDNNLFLYCALMFVVTMAGGMITLVRKWSDDWLHLFLSLGAGIFLGAVFFHLLPEAMEYEVSQGSGAYILIGYLLIFLIERFIAHRGGDQNGQGHFVVSLTALIGLSVHSVMDGFGLVVVWNDPELAKVLFASILAHKIPAAFSLASLMILAKQSRAKIVTGLVVFAATAPIGALALAPILGDQHTIDLRPFMGVVTGSFMYVATADLLPEVFHSRRRRWINLGLMIIGIVLMGYFGPEHGHH